jgi:hypothetical protein
MVYTAHPQISPLATSAANQHPFFDSTSYELSSVQAQARLLGHPNARKHAPKAPVVHHPARRRPHLPPGVEEQPF